MTRTMGVDQVPGGLDVAVMEFGDGEPKVLWGGRISNEHAQALIVLKQLAHRHEVQRGLIDPRPDDRLAALVLREMPSVFSIEDGSHTGASLAEVAYRRIEAVEEAPLPAPPAAPAQVVGIEHKDDRSLIVSVYVPAGERAPSHAIIPLEGRGGSVLDHPSGARVVDHEVAIPDIGVTQASASKLMGARQVWALAPTTKLPTVGWTFVLSLYAGDGSLMHEQALTEGQMMGLMNLVPEATREAATWLETVPLPAGPYTATFEIFAGPTSVYQQTTVPLGASAFGSTVSTSGETFAQWIEANAVDVELAHPGINIPAPDPFSLPDIGQDSYDFPEMLSEPENPLA